MKYGLKSIFRTPVKTILFALLIAVVTGFLSLGVGMYDSAEKMLDEADTVFKTAGDFVFTEGNYPITSQYDEKLAAARANFNVDEFVTGGVVSMEQSVALRGSIDGYIPQEADMPYDNYAVVTATVIRTEMYGMVCRVDQVHFQESNRIQQGFNVTVWPEEYDIAEIINGQQYIFFGEQGMLPASRDIILNGRSFTEDLGIPEGYGACGNIYDVTGCDPAEFWQSGAGAYFQMAMDKMKTENNAEDLFVSWDIASMTPFHQGGYALVEGAFPADHSVSACVIANRMAAQMGVGVGGAISVNIHYPASDGGSYDTYQPQAGFAAQETFLITGIYKPDNMTSAIYALDSGQPWLAVGGADYNLARVVVSNRSAADYVTSIEGKLPQGVILELFDQGYEAATHAIYNMREMVSLIMVVAALVGAAVLWFFAYLFVFRANESVRVLLRLGAGARRTLAFLLSGSGLIAAIAAALGCLAGYLVSGRVIDAVYAASGMSDIYDYRFSILSRGTNAEIFKPDPNIAPVVYIVVFAVVLAAALLLCLLFGLAVIRSQNAHLRYKKAAKKSMAARRAASAGKKRRVTDADGGKNRSNFYDHIPGVPLRYTVRSILRGGGRSFVVPILFTIMLSFVFVFNRVQNGYRQELDSVYDDVPVKLWLTNINTMQNGLNLAGTDIATLEESGYVKDAWYTDNFRYMYLGLYEHADGTPAEEPAETYNIPMGSEWAYETFEEQVHILTNPLAMVKNFTQTPDFANLAEDAVTWAEGMSPEAFEEGEMFSGAYAPILVSQSYAVEKGLVLNDVVRLGCFFVDPFSPQWNNYDEYFRVAGIYTAEVNYSTIIAPDYMNVTYTMSDWRGGPAATYSAAGFTVSQPRQLSAFKDRLEQSFDPVGKVGANRRWVVIDDKALYNTIENLTRYIGYMNMLYPVMMAVVAAIGFIASSLLLKSRGAEIAALRSLGARVPQVFSAFFMEPVFLSIPGIALGVALAVVFLGFSPGAALAGVPLLAACYYLGAAAAAVHTYRKAIMISLKAEE